MKNKRLRALVISVAVGLVGVGGYLTPTVGATTSHSTLPTVIFGEAGYYAGFAPLLLFSTNPNYCAPYGVQVTAEKVGGTQLAELVLAGQLNVGIVAGAQWAIAAAAGGPKSLIAFAGSGPLLYEVYGAPGITSLKQFAGKTLVTTGPGSGGQLGLDYLLPSLGIPRPTWDYVANGTIENNDVGSGTFVGTAGIVPLPQAYVAEGEHPLYNLSANPKIAPIGIQPMFANATYFAHNQRTLKRFLNCFAASMKFSKNPRNKQFMLNEMEQWVGYTPAEALTAYHADSIGWQLFPFTVGQARTTLHLLAGAGEAYLVKGFIPGQDINTAIIKSIKGAVPTPILKPQTK